MTLPSNTLSAAKSVAVPFRLSSCVIVPHRPFFRGRPGWVRSKAWIWLFSSTHNTIPFCGGFKYRPTTSVNFSMNWGSRDSLKVRIRCGLRLCNCQSRFTVLLLTPWALAMVRQLQCVIPLGLVSSVARIKASRFSSSYRSEEHTSELQSHSDLVCRLLLEKKKEYDETSSPLNLTTTYIR